MATDTSARQRVLIVGGGFAGLTTARRLDSRRFEVTLVDERNFHLFQPLLYQVATGSLAASDIATPLRMVVARHHVRVLQDRAVDVDPQARTVTLSQGRVLEYDRLVIATGVTHGYFGHDEWAADAPGLKALEDAFDVRARVFSAFEQAERCGDEQARQSWLRFVVIGAGATGVEVAGALAELTRRSLAGEFETFDPRSAEVYLVEGADRVLPPYSPRLSRYAQTALERLGVKVRTGAMVTDVDADGVEVREGDTTSRIESHTKIWAAGVQINDFGRHVLERTGVELGPGKRARVAADFSLQGLPEVFIVGDLAYYDHEGTPLPGVATAAIQAGKYVADHLQGKAKKPFHFRDFGQLAVIGRNAAAGRVGRFELTGTIAWWLWLLVHIRELIGFDVKLKVLVTWAWRFLFDKYGARLITRVRGGAPDAAETPVHLE